MSDTLHLWWLGRPDMPRYIGELHLFRPLKGVSLRYATGWLASGFPLSENLPLIPQELLPNEPETAAGAVDDARPDRWGERVIRFIDKPQRLADYPQPKAQAWQVQGTDSLTPVEAFDIYERNARHLDLPFMAESEQALWQALQHAFGKWASHV